MTDVPPDELVVRPFADWLRDQSQGKSHDELSDALFDLVQRVKDTRKAGYLVYTVKVEPFTKADSEVLTVTDAIKLKLPEHDRKPSLFYTDKTGNLSRTDPNQPTFEGLREVPGGLTIDKHGEVHDLKEIN